MTRNPPTRCDARPSHSVQTMRQIGIERSALGITLIELMVVMAVASVIMATSVPSFQNALLSYHLRSATADVGGSIQSTRYQAVMSGCSYTIAFTQNSTSYQLATQIQSGTPPACATNFSNVGSAIPWSTTGDVTLSPATTLQFSPNGTVTATTGTLSFTLSNGVTTKTITVSGVGNVTISP